jgi:alpha-tubulin suppressor-like RCC1 family protein
LERTWPALIETIKDVRDITAADQHSLGVTRSGTVFRWGSGFHDGTEIELRPFVVEGFGAVQVSSVCAGIGTAFATGEAGQLLSWGSGEYGRLGHGDTKEQPSPKRVEALRDVRVSSVSVGPWHVMALAEDGLVYAWGENRLKAVLGNPHGEEEGEDSPKPVEALRGVRVGSIAAAAFRSYAVADTGEVWAWGVDGVGLPPLGHGERMNCPLPKPIESLRGIKVDAVVGTSLNYTLALAGDGSVYTWGNFAAREGALGLGPSVSDAGQDVPTPQRIPSLRVAFAL